MNVKKICEILNNYADLKLSKLFIEKYDAYDNSGIIFDNLEDIKGILTCLDLTFESVKTAIDKGCNLIITHHPAIYKPILSLTDDNPLTLAVKNSIGVISFHLNLDASKTGVDYYFAKGLGAKNQEILMTLDTDCGYGRKFEINKPLIEIVNSIKREFNTEKVLVYGDLSKNINTICSFCGAGLDYYELSLSKDADLIISADVPHHILKECIEKGKCVIQLTHYASEIYGFTKFYEWIKEEFKGVNVFLHVEPIYL